MQTELSLRIDWSELDAFGHVNNVMFMKYVQAARVNFVEQIGLMHLYETQKIGFMVAETTCKFKKALHFPGNVVIQTKNTFTKTTSFSIEHTILNQHNELVAIANDVLVVFDFTKNEKCAIPENIKATMETN